MNIWFTGLLLAQMLCSVTAQSFSGPENFGRVNSPSVDQASGLAHGLRNSQVLWTHNDQTDGRVFAIGTNGTLLASFALNRPVEDLEDISVATLPDGKGPHLYVGDLGNNFGGRPTIRIFRAPEPSVGLGGGLAPPHSNLSGVEVFTLKYPDGSYNAEPLLIDPLLSKMYVLTKTAGNARVYGVDMTSLVPGGTNMLRFEGEIYFPWLTAGTVSADGRLIALRSAGRATMWERSSSQTIVDALRQTGVAIPVVGPPEEENGEGITFAVGGMRYFTISEGLYPAVYSFRRQAGSSGAATWIGQDNATLGNWRGVHGGHGQIIHGDSFGAPLYVQMGFEGAQTWVWSDSSSDQSALLRQSGTGRLASCWYSPTQFSVRLTFTDNQEHKVSFYLLDWDTTQRAQQVEVLDAANGAVLHTRREDNFHEGRYLVFSLRGDVRVRFTRLAGYNAVLSGIFFDSAAATVAAPQIVPNGGTFTGPVSVSMQSASEGSTIYYTLDGSKPTSSSLKYNGPFQLTSSARVSAMAIAGGAESAVSTADFQVTSPGPVRFLGTDLTTRGNWRGTYGATGFVVVNDWTAMSNGAQVTPSGHSSHVWAYNVSDVAALQKYSSAGRIAACWYSASGFQVDVANPAGVTRKVRLYFLDWDMAGRVQSVQLLSATGEILDTRQVSAFQGGVYLAWEFQGSVRFKVNRGNGPNAVLSGVFID